MLYTVGSQQDLQGDLTFEVSDHTEINNDNNKLVDDHAPYLS